MALDSHPGFCSLVNLSTLGPPCLQSLSFSLLRRSRGCVPRGPMTCPMSPRRFRTWVQSQLT